MELIVVDRVYDLSLIVQEPIYFTSTSPMIYVDAIHSTRFIPFQGFVLGSSPFSFFFNRLFLLYLCHLHYCPTYFATSVSMINSSRVAVAVKHGP